MFNDLPESAAWRHEQAREGVEVVFVSAGDFGYRFDGHTAAVEDGRAWVVRYALSLDAHWVTRRARVWRWSTAGTHRVQLESDGAGHWAVNGSRLSELDGCLDVDLESSVCTNTVPIHRLTMSVGQSMEAPAVYVRALDLRIERIEQEYTRVGDDATEHRYDYSSPTFDFNSRLVYDASGLVFEYPGIATRIH